MNSLEYIDLLIKSRVNSKETFLENSKRYPDNEVLINCAKRCDEDIKTLQQIKTELEVLKILKPQLDLEYEDGEDDKFMIGMRHYVGLETKQVELVKEVLYNE